MTEPVAPGCDFVRAEVEEAPPPTVIRLVEATPAVHQRATALAEVEAMFKGDGHHHDDVVRLRALCDDVHRGVDLRAELARPFLAARPTQQVRATREQRDVVSTVTPHLHARARATIEALRVDLPRSTRSGASVSKLGWCAP
jgi:hypothetical protein